MSIYNYRKMISNVITQFFRLIGLIPRKWSVASANFMGAVLFALSRKHRQIAMENLTRVYGNNKNAHEIKTLCRDVFKNFSQIIFEMGWSLWIQPEEHRKYFKIEGLNNKIEAQKKNKGVLLLMAHLGNWELAPCLSYIFGYDISVIYRPLDFEPLDRFFIQFRSRFGAQMIPKDGAMRRVLRSLKQGRAVALLMDQNVDWYEGVFVDFFKQRAATNKGLALLALKTGAPVLPCFIVREKTGFKLVIGDEVPLIKSGDKTKDIEANTQQYNKVIESFILQYPEQWFWVHQRWKTKPYHLWPKE